MLLRDLKLHFHSELDALYDPNEVANFFYLLCDHYLDFPKHHLAMYPQQTISMSDTQLFKRALEALKQHVPIQYIMEQTEFFGVTIKVNNSVLIPRPETEELVAWIIEHLQNTKEHSPKILDIGTGSGCIAIALAAKLKDAEIDALDVSIEALDLARSNAELNAVSVTFYSENILDPDKKNGLSNKKYDLIVSNPPYVRVSEKQLMQDNVLKNEPHLALFVENEDPLLFYKAILNFCSDHLVANGYLFFEINEYLADEMLSLISAFDFEKVELKRDLFGKERMIKARKIK
ncbi:MAG: peptide chain release factor N(5)-glutamine methyltransferase [Bacteroidia bacterium]|nr:peptide chain release factor N(5)-glutamine methyltransferase [Bacteroidia bacterium]NNK59596.1 peptide chain release factor N(5)-glutamine methyltransferase [Flavobacteriaceae bacterium]